MQSEKFSQNAEEMIKEIKMRKEEEKIQRASPEDRTYV